MEARRRKLVVLLVAINAACSLGVSSVALAADGTADGVLTINGATFPLKHAYASAKPGFFDKNKEDIHVLLSDVPLTDEQQADVFEIIHLARDGKAHVVEVVLDAEQRPIAGSFFTQPFEGMVSATGMHVFEAKAFEHKRIAGRLYTDGARTFQNVTYEYTATFSAVIPRPPTAEEVATALASPAGLAAAAYVTAILENNFASFVAMLADPLAGTYHGPDGPNAFNAVRLEMPKDSKVVGLTAPTDTTAIATVNGSRDGIVIESMVELAFVKGKWKVAKVP